MRGPRFTAQMPNPVGISTGGPDDHTQCACGKKNGLGFAVPEAISQWNWQTVLLVVIAAWLIGRELIDRDKPARRSR